MMNHTTFNNDLFHIVEHSETNIRIRTSAQARDSLNSELILLEPILDIGRRQRQGISLAIDGCCLREVSLPFQKLNKEIIFPLVFYARSLLPESSLTIYGSLRARKIGFFIQNREPYFDRSN